MCACAHYTGCVFLPVVLPQRLFTLPHLPGSRPGRAPPVSRQVFGRPLLDRPQREPRPACVWPHLGGTDLDGIGSPDDPASPIGASKTANHAASHPDVSRRFAPVLRPNAARPRTGLGTQATDRI